MKISDNTLAAYMAGVSTVQEDKLVLNEIVSNANFADLLDVMDEVDAIDGLDELRNEFNESVEDIDDYNDYDINIR